MNSTPDPKEIKPHDALIAGADEGLAHAHEQIKRADEQLTRLTEQLARSLQEWSAMTRVHLRPDLAQTNLARTPLANKDLARNHHQEEGRRS